MEKDFDKWNKRKKEIEKKEPNFYYEREIRLAVLGKERFEEIKKSHQRITVMTFFVFPCVSTRGRAEAICT